MADTGNDVEKTIQSFVTMLKASDLKKTGDELVAAFATLVAAYRAIKTDTEAERQRRDREFTNALRDLRTAIDTRLAELRGTDGRNGTNGKDGAQGPIGPAGRNGMSVTGPKGDPGADGSPDSADDIRNKLELLTGKDRLTVDAIDGLAELLAEMDKKTVGMRTGMAQGMGVTGRDLFNDIDLSPQLDGITSTFQIHAVYNIISVHLSSFPHALRKNIDFTYTPTTITFTAQIDPATALAAGQTCVLTVVNA